MKKYMVNIELAHEELEKLEQMADIKFERKPKILTTSGWEEFNTFASDEDISYAIKVVLENVG